MKNDKKNNAAKTRHRKLLLAGACTKCMGPRTTEPGFTLSLCAACAKKNRLEATKRYRLKKGLPLHAKIEEKKHGPRANFVSSIERSNVYDPSAYVPSSTGRPRKMLGSLTRADVRAATSALPLRPPGK